MNDYYDSDDDDDDDDDDGLGHYMQWLYMTININKLDLTRANEIPHIHDQQVAILFRQLAGDVKENRNRWRLVIFADGVVGSLSMINRSMPQDWHP